MKQIQYSMGGRRVSLGYSEDNLRLALLEADNGDYVIEDDGQPDEQTPEQRIAELEEALALLLSGVTE